jgi:hypothetical protein
MVPFGSVVRSVSPNADIVLRMKLDRFDGGCKNKVLDGWRRPVLWSMLGRHVKQSIREGELSSPRHTMSGTWHKTKELWA